MTVELTYSDVQQLAGDLSATNRRSTAAKVSQLLAEHKLTANEVSIALDILDHMVQDVDHGVRQALSDHLKSSPMLPRSIARRLADDIESVALPILRFSEVFSAADLIEIVRQGADAKQIAIAERDRVPETVSDALIETGKEVVIGTLVANVGAEISEPSLAGVVDRFSDREGILTSVAERPALPPAVTERLTSLVVAGHLATALTDKLRERLIAHHHLPPSMAEEMIVQGRERAMARLARKETDGAEVEALVGRLVAQKALTPTLLLRSLGSGDLQFFETGMAMLAHMSRGEAAELIHQSGIEGFRRLYVAAGLPAALRRAFAIAMEVVKADNERHGDIDPARYTPLMIRQIVGDHPDLNPGSLESILAQLHHKATKAQSGY